MSDALKLPPLLRRSMEGEFVVETPSRIKITAALGSRFAVEITPILSVDPSDSALDPGK